MREREQALGAQNQLLEAETTFQFQGFVDLSTSSIEAKVKMHSKTEQHQSEPMDNEFIPPPIRFRGGSCHLHLIRV